MAQQEFLRDEAGLDGLAEADVVGDEQVDPKHGQRTRHRGELMGFDGDPGAERRLERPLVGPGDGAPADGVDEGARQRGRRELALLVTVVGTRHHPLLTAHADELAHLRGVSQS